MTSRWTNLAQIGACYPGHHHYPCNTKEVQQSIAFVRASKAKCRVAGAGKSPNTSTFTNDHLIHMTRMDKILSIDVEARMLTCEPGALMEDVMKALDAVGLMIRCVPSYVQTTIGGCIATATHSSGIKCHSLSDYVREVTLVDGRGEVRTLTTGKDDAELRLVACHLGMMGVVTQIKLEVQPRIEWVLKSQPLSMADATNIALVAKKCRENEYYRWWWVPHTDGCYESYGNIERVSDPQAVAAANAKARRPSQCDAEEHKTYAEAVKEGVEGADPPTRRTPKRAGTDDGLLAQYGAVTKPSAEETVSAGDAAPPPAQNTQSANTSGAKVTTVVMDSATVMASLKNWFHNELIRHRLVEWSLWLACRFPDMQPAINRAYQQYFFTQPMVQRGSALECFTFDCLFLQWANEWAIDANRAVEAFERLQAMIEKEKMLVHFPVEFRFAAADASDMSPAVGRQTCWVGIVMYRPHGCEARDTRRYYDGFNKIMESMGGRPHWAKYYNWGHREMSKAYGTHWDRFLELRQKMDPDSVFVNEWFSNLMSSERRNSTVFTGK